MEERAPEERGARARCPTCGARRREGASECYRCRSDLRLLLSLEALADRKLAEAIEAYRAGRFRIAAALARESYRIEARPECLGLAAASAARAGDFAFAVRAALRLLGSGGAEGS